MQYFTLPCISHPPLPFPFPTPPPPNSLFLPACCAYVTAICAASYVTTICVNDLLHDVSLTGHLARGRRAFSGHYLSVHKSGDNLNALPKVTQGYRGTCCPARRGYDERCVVVAACLQCLCFDGYIRALGLDEGLGSMIIRSRSVIIRSPSQLGFRMHVVWVRGGGLVGRIRDIGIYGISMMTSWITLTADSLFSLFTSI